MLSRVARPRFALRLTSSLKFARQIPSMARTVRLTPQITRSESKRMLSTSFEEDNIVYSCAAVQRPAPGFKAAAVVGDAFKDVQLSDYAGKWVVLFFYPLDFTFVCPTEIVAFSDRMKEFRELGVELLGVSVDSKFSHLAWIKASRKEGGLGGKLNYPLVSDITKSISRDYGVLLEKDGIALRGLFIIDPKGVVRQITVNDLPVGRSVDETLRLIKAFQYNEKHGEVCPSDWQPGKPTMKGDPQGSKQFWQKHF